MQLWERAYLYVRRKKRQSLLLGITIFLLSSFSVTGLLLHSVTDFAVTQTRESLSGAFRIAPDMRNRDNVRVSDEGGQTKITYIGQPLNEEVADTVQRTQQIELYNAVIKENGLLQGDIKLIDYNGKYQDDPIAMRLISIEANTDSLYSADFQRERLRLSDGEQIRAEDKYAALISKDLALQNAWKIGDKIQLLPYGNPSGQEVWVTIKGLFQVEEEQQNTDVAAPVHLLENRIFLDMASARHLTADPGADYIDFFVDDPAQVAAMIKEIQKISNINWNCFAITPKIDEYEKIANPLASMTVLLNTLLAVTGIMSIAALALIQILCHKARVHETGILLSTGISKKEILLQHFSEMILISSAAFILSSALCLFGWNGISDLFVRMTMLNINGKLDAALTAKTIAATFGYGILILFLSVLLSDLWLMRLNPKKILSKT